MSSGDADDINGIVNILGEELIEQDAKWDAQEARCNELMGVIKTRSPEVLAALLMHLAIREAINPPCLDADLHNMASYYFINTDRIRANVTGEPITEDPGEHEEKELYGPGHKLLAVCVKETQKTADSLAAETAPTPTEAAQAQEAGAPESKTEWPFPDPNAASVAIVSAERKARIEDEQKATPAGKAAQAPKAKPTKKPAAASKTSAKAKATPAAKSAGKAAGAAKKADAKAKPTTAVETAPKAKVKPVVAKAKSSGRAAAGGSKKTIPTAQACASTESAARCDKTADMFKA